MINVKCPNCKNSVSNRWLINSNYSETYTCRFCKISLKWNKIKYLISFVSYLVGFEFIIMTKESWMINSQLIKALISGLIIVIIPKIIIILLPNFLFSKLTGISNNDWRRK